MCNNRPRPLLRDIDKQELNSKVTQNTNHVNEVCLVERVQNDDKAHGNSDGGKTPTAKDEYYPAEKKDPSSRHNLDTMHRIRKVRTAFALLSIVSLVGTQAYKISTQ